jgi:hypothetical protein
MNENQKNAGMIRKTVRTVVLENSMELTQLGGLANCIADYEMIRVDETDIPNLVTTLTAASQKGNTVVAVKKDTVAELCKALNRNLLHGKLIIIQNGQTDDKEYYEEIAGMMLHTGNGSAEYFPEKTQHPDMFQDDGRVLIRSNRKPENFDCALFRSDGTYWGELLPEQMRCDDYAGTLSELSVSLSNAEKGAIVCRVGTEEHFAEPESILVFRTEKELFTVPLPDAPQISSRDLQLYLLTGLTPEAGTVTLMQALFRCSGFRQGIELAEHYCMNIF